MDITCGWWHLPKGEPQVINVDMLIDGEPQNQKYGKFNFW